MLIRKKRIFAVLVCAILLTYYLTFAILDGPVICADSPSYIGCFLSREPFYCAFLAIFRVVFGETIYLNVVVIVQSLFMGLCTFSLVNYIRREFALGILGTCPVTAVCLGVSLVCKLFTAHKANYCNLIMTEGICVSLVLIFFRLIIDFIINERYLRLIWASLVAAVAITTRKQMYFILMVMLIAVIFVALRHLIGNKMPANNKDTRKFWKPVIYLVLCIVFIFAFNKGFEAVYSRVVYGESTKHFNDNRFFTTVAFYVAEREDGELIEDPEIRELFYTIYDECDAEGSMMHSASGNIVDVLNHYGDHYDMIQIDHMWPEIEAYAEEKVSGGSLAADSIDIAREEITDAVSSTIFRELLPKIWPKMLLVFGRSFYHRMVNTVGRATTTWMYAYAVILFAVYIFMLIYLGIKRRSRKTVIFASFVLLSATLNIALVSVVIFCQVRYVIYNMPLMYIALFLMAREIFGGAQFERKKLNAYSQ